MADGILTILLRNVEVNLRDTTNYSSLSALKGWATVDEWRPLSLADPYVVIEPGPQGDTVQGIAAQSWEQPVNVYVAKRSGASLTGERALLGVKTTETSGLDSLATFVRKALTRPSPYSDRKPSGASYVAQTGVLHVEHVDTEYIGYQADAEEESAGVQVIRLGFIYYMVDSKA
ncbi:MAG TPA: hypothetical protein VM223_22475 [Planctomycetota bacterium]|nr:hypothetical protein [Planctomycetota bacterium]